MRDTEPAQIIWDYMLMKQPLRKCDVIFVLCSIDERVAEYAAQLFNREYGDWLIFSGGETHTDDVLKTRWHGSEAEYFAKIALRAGVPKDRILIENQAQNTGQNIQFTYKLLQERKLHPNSILLVQKPYMERRTYATFKKQWPGPTTDFIVKSPPIPFYKYFDEVNTQETVINIMVGDLQRIREYPAQGYQIEQPIPANVWDAWGKLIKLGYTKHLL